MPFLPTLSQSALLIGHYGYLIMFLLAVPEGPIVAVIAGFFVSLGALDAYLSFAVLFFGDVVGDALYYALGRWGGEKFIPRFGKYVGITEKKVGIFKKRFLKHDWKIILFSKTQAVGSAMLFSAGFVRMPFWRYLLYNSIGTIPKVLLFEVIGIYFGRGYASINTYIGYVGIASFAFAFLLLGAYWWFKRKFTFK